MWIKGRAKRFAKIAGELVSLGALEDIVSGRGLTTWSRRSPAPTEARRARDPRHHSLGRDAAGDPTWLKIKGASALMVPNSVVVLDAIPLLGSGKTDYIALRGSAGSAGVGPA